MGLKRIVAAAVMLTACSTASGLTGPAFATDDITQNAIGVYKYRNDKQKKVTNSWVLTPCDDGAKQCVQVNVYAAKDKKLEKTLLSGRAHWVVGSWIMFIDEKLKCKEGPTQVLNINYSWDAAANRGNRSFFDPGVCEGSKARSGTTPFTLIKTGPPPASLADLPPPPPAVPELLTPPPPAEPALTASADAEPPPSMAAE